MHKHCTQTETQKKHIHKCRTQSHSVTHRHTRTNTAHKQEHINTFAETLHTTKLKLKLHSAKSLCIQTLSTLYIARLKGDPEKPSLHRADARPLDPGS